MGTSRLHFGQILDPSDMKFAKRGSPSGAFPSLVWEGLPFKWRLFAPFLGRAPLEVAPCFPFFGKGPPLRLNQPPKKGTPFSPHGHQVSFEPFRTGAHRQPEAEAPNPQPEARSGRRSRPSWMVRRVGQAGQKVGDGLAPFFSPFFSGLGKGGLFVAFFGPCTRSEVSAFGFP